MHQRSYWLLAVAASLTMGGCRDRKEPSPSMGPVPNLQVNSAPARKFAHGDRMLESTKPRRVGSALVLGYVLQQSGRLSNITPEQKSKLDALGKADREKTTSPYASMKPFREAVAESVRLGKVEPKALSDKTAALEKEVNDEFGKVLQQLQELHSLLTSEQRGELLKNVEQDLGEVTAAPSASASASQAKPVPSGAKPAGSNPASAKAPGASAASGDSNPKMPHSEWKKGFGDMMKLRLGKPRVRDLWALVDGLQLEESQKTKIQELREKRANAASQDAANKAAAKDVISLLQSLAKDKFDAAQTPLFQAPKDMVTDYLADLAAVVAILSPEQRNKLADSLSGMDDIVLSHSIGLYQGLFDRVRFPRALKLQPR